MARGCRVWLGGGVGGVHGRGACMAGDMHGRGMCVVGGGGMHGRGDGMHGRGDGHCSGRYASY